MAVWIALVCGILLFLFLYLFVITKVAPANQVRERVQRLQQVRSIDEQARVESENLDKPFSERIVLPFFREVEEQLIRLAPGRNAGSPDYAGGKTKYLECQCFCILLDAVLGGVYGGCSFFCFLCQIHGLCPGICPGYFSPDHWGGTADRIS